MRRGAIKVSKEIKLHGKTGMGKLATVDDDLYGWLNQHRWFMGVDGYVIRYDNNRSIKRLHREIMQPSENQVVDHINGDTLDNRVTNLRVCSPKENSRNRKKQLKESASKYKGVYKSNSNQWYSSITVDQRIIYLGQYGKELEAAKAYDYFANKYFGKYARLNFPDEDIKLPASLKLLKSNTSGYRGVSRLGDKWVAYVDHNKKKYYLGMFETAEEAALFYNFWAIDLKEDSAILNKL